MKYTFLTIFLVTVQILFAQSGLDLANRVAALEQKVAAQAQAIDSLKSLVKAPLTKSLNITGFVYNKTTKQKITEIISVSIFKKHGDHTNLVAQVVSKDGKFVFENVTVDNFSDGSSYYYLDISDPAGKYIKEYADINERHIFLYTR